MKANYRLFVGLAIFYAITTFIYYYVGGEPLGISCLLLSSLLAAMIGYYVWFTDRRIGVTLPEDNMQGEIADSAGCQHVCGWFGINHWLVAHPARCRRTCDQHYRFCDRV
jgi:hypothetical protein